MRFFKPLIIIPLLAGVLVGCVNMQKDVVEKMAEVKKGPQTTPTRNITNFATALRCMDNLMIDYGIRDISVLVEDLDDRTSQVKAGTKDMLITAVSDMTKRSRAIHLIAFGNDSGNLISFIAASGRKSVYSQVPDYDIRGSISQLDEDVVSKQADAGIGIVEVGAGASTSARGSVLGLDLSIISTSNMAVIPGVTSRNSIIIIKSGKGVDADASIKKLGVNFSFSLSQSEGKHQALRNLVELAMVELFGRLLKIPYWNCIGIDVAHEDIKTEMADWYYAMNANAELIPYLKKQLRQRGYYQGVVNDQNTPQYSTAVALYQQNHGLGATGRTDMQFLDTFWNKPVVPNNTTSSMEMDAGANVATNTRPEVVVDMASKTKTRAKSKADAKSTTDAGDREISVVFDIVSKSTGMSIGSSGKSNLFKPGERFDIIIKPQKNGYLYCFYSDDEHNIIRFFPNRYHRDNYVSAGDQIKFPGDMPFELTASTKGATESVGCFTTQRDVFNKLPDAIRIVDFVKLSVLSLEEIRYGFEQVAGNDLGEGYFSIKTKAP